MTSEQIILRNQIYDHLISLSGRARHQAHQMRTETMMPSAKGMDELSKNFLEACRLMKILNDSIAGRDTDYV